MTLRLKNAFLAVAFVMGTIVNAIAQEPMDGFASTPDSVTVEEHPAEINDIIARINQSGTVKVSLPAGLEATLVNRSASVSDSRTEAAPQNKAQRKVGYKVQVFDDNNVHTAKVEAENRGRMIHSRFPEMEVTTEFHSPYWRVKVGNFRTRSEAENAMAAIRAAFPSIGSQLRVVRDRINLHN